MGLKRWDPFKDIMLLQDRMSRIFDEALLKYKGCPSGPAWYPPVDIYENEDRLVLKAELPGIDIKDIHIEVKENTLFLRGERKHCKNLTDENYHRMERFYGAFQRVFSLPYIVEKDGIEANIKDGLLEITVPKAAVKADAAIKIKVQ